MKIQFTEEAWKDFEWFMDKDKRIVKRIRELLKDIGRHPEEGIGKPEPLKLLGSGVWSRRITQEHRLVYVVGPERIDFVQARYHY